MNLVVGD
jgi:hypothetical protein